MYYVIPLGGTGDRFKIAGYIKPKPKEIIFWLLDLLIYNIDIEDKIIIIYNPELDNYNFKSIINNEYRSPDRIIFYRLNHKTRGAAETLHIFSQYAIIDDSLDKNTSILCLDGDNTYNNDSNLVAMSKKYNGKNFVVLTAVDKDVTPVYSYVKINENIITHIVEKEAISDNICTGGYGFESIEILHKYSKILISDDNHMQKGEYYTSGIYKIMLDHKETIYPAFVNPRNFICFGTPLQVRSFCNNYPVIRADNKISYIKSLRICFDLDNTLITFPDIPGDYSTVHPIDKNIKYAQYLKKLGHTIIIYTARNMKTQMGNVSKVMVNVGKVTLDTISKLDIPCDELYFGKPYADLYIDDLAVNPYDNDVDKILGIYQENVDTRSFNMLETRTIDIYRKNGDPNILIGEIYWYNSMHNSIKDMFPLFFGNSDTYEWYDMEKIKGSIISDYLFKSKSDELLNIIDSIIGSLTRIHQCDISNIPNISNINIYQCYSNKLKNRYKNFDYAKLLGSDVIYFYNDLQGDLDEYESQKLGIKSVCHGDPVCTNILINQYGKIKFIDMRGLQGDELTVIGDRLYDWAKLYQSLYGYDAILFDKNINVDIMLDIRKYFIKSFINTFGINYVRWLHIITASLLFTLIPLHNPKLALKYYNLAKIIYNS